MEEPEIEFDDLPKFNGVSNLEIRAGCFYAPCSGDDLRIGFAVCGDLIDRFVFCDLQYGRDTDGRVVSAAGAVPEGWHLVSRHSGRDEAQPPKAAGSGRRPFQPWATQEIWRRPDGSLATVVLRLDLAQDRLRASSSHRARYRFSSTAATERTKESNLWFLLEPRDGRDIHALLDKVVPRLVDGAIVVTDSRIVDPLVSPRGRRPGLRHRLGSDLRGGGDRPPRPHPGVARDPGRRQVGIALRRLCPAAP